LPTLEHFEKVEELMNSFVKAQNEVVLEGLDLEMAQILCETLIEMTDALVVKQEKGINVSEFFAPYIYDFLVMTLRCMGCFHTFKLSNKEEPEEIIENK
jgi:rRNA maturation endonuclease Nob1